MGRRQSDQARWLAGAEAADGGGRSSGQAAARRGSCAGLGSGGDRRGAAPSGVGVVGANAQRTARLLMASGPALLAAPALPTIQSCAAGRELLSEALQILHTRAPVMFGMAFRGWWHRLPPRVCAPAGAPVRQQINRVRKQGIQAQLVAGGAPARGGGSKAASRFRVLVGVAAPRALERKMARLRTPNGSQQAGACWWSRRIRVAALTSLAGRGCEGSPPPDAPPPIPSPATGPCGRWIGPPERLSAVICKAGCPRQRQSTGSAAEHKSPILHSAVALQKAWPSRETWRGPARARYALHEVPPPSPAAVTGRTGGVARSGLASKKPRPDGLGCEESAGLIPTSARVSRIQARTRPPDPR